MPNARTPHQPTQEPDANITTALESSDFYDAYWSRQGGDLDYTQLMRVRFVCESIESFVDRANPDILDLGCGYGWMAPFLQRLGSVTGVDFGAEGIERASRTYGHLAKFYRADPDSSRLGIEEQFDVVVCSEVIEHVPDPRRFLTLIRTFVRERGWCMLTTPNGNVWEEFVKVPSFRDQLQPVENWIRPEELLRLFDDCGFEVVQHEGRPVYSFRLGWRGGLQAARIEHLAGRLGLTLLWGRLILSTAVYQVIAARAR